MTKLLVIGDLHLHNKFSTYLKDQVNCIKRIIREYLPERVVFLGDIFERRHPSPTELLAFKDLLATCEEHVTWGIHILRGNHDSETKATDSKTALSVYTAPSSKIHVITQPLALHLQDVTLHFIPHYEDEKIIKRELKNVDRSSILFGHFGFRGCLNTAGDADFNISPDAFPCDTILGHIHHFKRYTTDASKDITVLGTPYSISYQENDKICNVGIFD